MASTSPVKIIFGGGGLGRHGKEKSQEFLEILEKNNVKDVDTAFAYVDSEKILGELGAPKKFIIHSKAPGWRPHALSKESIQKGIEKQFTELGVDSVETYFLHAPDPTTPIEETLEAINDLYIAKKFKYFGLSNFQPSDVSNIHAICTAKYNFLPVVYQGNYNPVARHSEDELFPVLRKLNIRFYAYSPLAGGFLTKDASIFTDLKAASGRWSAEAPIGAMYRSLYGKPSLIKALGDWEPIAKDAGISKSALAYRWVFFHSALDGKLGDGCIIGASGGAQLEETLIDIKQGPLKEGVVQRIEEIWAAVKDEAPVDNYHSYAAGWKA